MTDANLAVRAARAEIERDQAIERAKRAEESLYAILSGDKERLLDTLHIIGIPARDLSDIYQIVSEWRAAGGRDAWLERWRMTHPRIPTISASDTLKRAADA